MDVSSELKTVGFAVMFAATFFVGELAPAAKAQSTAAQLQPAAAPTKVPDWQATAGGKIEFDVASVKQNQLSERQRANFPLDDGDAYPAQGGNFSATAATVNSFIRFAYKLTLYQGQVLLSELPKWATTDRFDIQARAEGNPTKDQMRLMMQSLLAERFKLAVHFETKQLPVFEVVLMKPGKLGPQFQPFTNDPPCPALPGSGAAQPPPANAGGLPCGFLGGTPTSDGLEHTGSRNLTMQQIANDLFWLGALDRSAIDRTGLSGKFDFSIQYKLELNGPQPNPNPDQIGPTFLEALKEQLGLKLEATKGPVEVLVIDHIERPSGN